MIDGGIFLGRNPTNGNMICDNVIGFMDHYGIESAVATHYKSIFYDFKEGNRDLLDIYRKHPGRIIPAIYISPCGFDILDDSGYLAEMRQAGARVFGIYKAPKYYDISLADTLLISLARQAASLGYVVQFGIETGEDLDVIVERYTELPCPVLIRWMSGGNYFALSKIAKLLCDAPHFYFDVGSLTTVEGIEFLVRRCGDERLYTASNSPESFLLCPLSLVSVADITEQQKENILSRNLSKILKDNSDISTMYRTDSSTRMVYEFISRPKIDIHYHIHALNIVKSSPCRKALRHVIKTFHYEKLIISSTLALNYDLERGNREVCELIEQENEMYGLIVIDPLRTADSLAMINRYGDHPKFVGLKTIQDFYNIDLDHACYAVIFEHNRRFNLPVLAHKGGILAAARKYPWMTFVCAHSTWDRVKDMVGQANLFFDISTSHRNSAETNLLQLIREAGEDKIIFASDGPLISPAWTLGKLVQQPFEEHILQKILYTNALSVFPKLTGYR